MFELEGPTGGTGTEQTIETGLLFGKHNGEEENLASVSTSVSGLMSMTLDPPLSMQDEETTSDLRRFWIRLANTPERRKEAELLVDRLYAREGYQHEGIVQNALHSITLIACNRTGKVIGTVTIRLDSTQEGLLADETYKDELDSLRARGKKICEFNGLAIDSSVRSKLVIARIFHIAMLYPWGLCDYTDCVIEVSPAHSGFYSKMLGFDQLGDERICQRVNTAGVLMHVDFAVAAERLARVGGLMKQSVNDKSLYPYGFSRVDAAGILDRLKRMV
ncbi:MAG: N-acyl amino acid synthase FeeM domain-containing protein [Leptospirales bacterium]